MPTKRVFVIPDVHVPYQDKKAVTVALRALETYEPDLIVCVGDLLDCYRVSSFSKSPTRGQSLQREIDEAARFLDAVRSRAPKARRVLLEGNHEYRLQKYVNNNASELACLRSLNMPDLLELKALGWEWVSSGRFFSYGPLNFTHGEFACVNSAKKHLDTYRTNIIYGHTHRLRSWSFRNLDGTQVEAWEAGCLAQMSVEYTKHANWQHGFLTIEVKGKSFWVTPHRMNERYQLPFMGELLDGRRRDLAGAVA